MSELKTKIYQKLKEVPFGKVVTYKILANSIGSSAYRAVGRLMRVNNDPINVPCYKVIRSSGDVGGYCGKISGKKIKEKIKKLKMEGIKIKNNKVVNLDGYLYRF